MVTGKKAKEGRPKTPCNAVGTFRDADMCRRFWKQNVKKRHEGPWPQIYPKERLERGIVALRVLQIGNMVADERLSRN